MVMNKIKHVFARNGGGAQVVQEMTIGYECSNLVLDFAWYLSR